MISVRRQEFYEVFMQGVIFLMIGILGYIIDSPIVNLPIFVLTVVYWVICFINNRKNKQKDDDLSKFNKYKAGYATMLIVFLIMMLAVTGIFFSKHTLSASIELDLRALFIVLGILMITYYLFFIHYEKVGE